MLRKMLLVVGGTALTVAGIAGLLLPLVPGLLLLAGAAACFSLASPRFHLALTGRLSRQPRARAALRRWHTARGLGAWARFKLAVGLTLDFAVPRRASQARRERLT